MASSVHLRLLGYGVTLAIHGYTSYDVMARLAVTTKDPIVADFATLQDKFLTIWTFVVQIIYVTLGLSCDILQTIGKRNQFLKSIQGLRETLFSALVWPTSLFVSALFWPFYLYDSGLVFPPYIDKILSWWNNQVMHTYVAFFVFWELMFLERRRRKDKLYLTLLISYMAVYLVVMFGSFIQRGTFIYPILTNIYGTVYFYIFFIIIANLLFLCYYVQWTLTSIVWRRNFGEKNNWAQKWVKIITVPMSHATKRVSALTKNILFLLLVVVWSVIILGVL